jgi:hypothetical protein
MAAGRKTGGRKRGVPNKVGADVRTAAAVYTTDAIATLREIMENPAEPAQARVAAARELLDRAHGKPPQAADVTVSGLAPIIMPSRIEIVAGGRDSDATAPTYRPRRDG